MSQPIAAQSARAGVLPVALATVGGLALALILRGAVDYGSLSGAYQMQAASAYALAFLAAYAIPLLTRARFPYRQVVRVLSFGSAAILALLAVLDHFDMPARDAYAALAVIVALVPGLLASIAPRGR
ncbi:hypothetical protein [Novosphingobium sp. FKTRR1]|uniref:hypothetical protein n=1 Tax=Novosphingobium sp. FKTRR1 TaxID=2879118 RepID=UPI001CEFCACB|nr:hypothetical protein [Novosphingobium sp. FKTRR1]